jgi:putative ATPase
MNSYPLASQLRPKTLDGVVGQPHLIGPGKPLSRIVDGGQLPSLIFWGPPGSGKTTLAHILANTCKMPFVSLSALSSGVGELRKIFEGSQAIFDSGMGSTLLFVDEIHRFNRAQQDSFLPHLENGSLTLMGATTENPSFELNNALLSRCQIFTLNRLDQAALRSLYTQAEISLKRMLPLTLESQNCLLEMADGDGRALVNLIEILASLESADRLDPQALSTVLSRRAPLYDKGEEGHYTLISTLHKSLRGSDPDAALYWFARMLAGGEDPLFIGRRLIRFASEDVGLADPQALIQALAGIQSYERLGSPEGELALVQALVYLATAPKSNAIHQAYPKAQQAARESGLLPPPKALLNAPTQWMKQEGYGAGYQYDHDTPEGFSGQAYFPERMKRQIFYTPVERGFEREIQKRLAYWQKLRRAKDRTG